MTTGKWIWGDTLAVLGYLFSRGAPPPEPFPDCGLDPTEDDLTCDSFTYCPRQTPIRLLRNATGHSDPYGKDLPDPDVTDGTGSFYDSPHFWAVVGLRFSTANKVQITKIAGVGRDITGPAVWCEAGWASFQLNVFKADETYGSPEEAFPHNPFHGNVVDNVTIARGKWHCAQNAPIISYAEDGDGPEPYYYVQFELLEGDRILSLSRGAT